MKSKILIAALVLVVGLGSTAFARHGKGEGMMKKTKTFFKNELKLEGAKWAEVEGILDAHHATMKAKKEAGKERRQQEKAKAEAQREKFLSADEATQIEMLDEMKAMREAHREMKKEKKEEVKAMRAQLDRELKGALSSDEFQAYELFKKKQEVERMKKHMLAHKDRKHGKPTHEGDHE